MSEITSPAAAVMHFVDVLIGARLSGFVETSTPTLAQIYQCARNHVMDNYGTHTSQLNDVVSADDFKVLSEGGGPDKTECVSKNPKTEWPESLEGIQVRSPAEFKQMFLGSFESNPRDAELEKELGKYYSETEHCSNKEAYKRWIEFRRWCSEAGYSLAEINQVKARLGR